MKTKNKSPVSEIKIKSVKEFSDLIKNNKTVLIASIKNIPASQFQQIGKKLRNKAIIKVPKKNLIFRALNSSEIEEIKKLKDKIEGNVAILFSDMNPFDLAVELINNKTPAKAKTGEEAPEDIEISAGPTDLVPGPAISELGNLGIKIQIEKGKITIKESKVITKKGEKISASAADIMNKLDIKPFLIGFIPLSAFDTQEKKLYLNIKIDKEGTLKELKNIFIKALAFALEIVYVSGNTIKLLINKAVMNEKILESLIDEQEQNTQELKSEEK